VNSTVQFTGTLTTPNGYSSPVHLRCGTGALPSICTVAPASVTPTAAGKPFTVTVGSNQCGVYSFNILAQGTDAYAVSHTVPVTFTSTSLAPPDYTLEITNSSLTAAENASAAFNGTLASTACYNSVVKLSCGSGAPPTCTASPSSLTPAVNGAPFTVTVQSNAAKTYSFDVVAVGTDPKAIQHEQLVSFTSTGGNSSSGFDFSLVNNSGQESVKAGQTATYNLQVAPCKILPCGATAKFPDAVSLAVVSGCPPLSTCSLSQTSVATGKSTTTIIFTAQTAAAVAANTQPGTSKWQVPYAVWLWLPGLMLTLSGGVSRRDSLRRPFALLVLLVAIIVLLSLLAACGGGLQGGGTASANPGTPAGTYNMTVSATMNSAPGSPTKTASVTLTVN
jgi:hypothetical protein